MSVQTGSKGLPRRIPNSRAPSHYNTVSSTTAPPSSVAMTSASAAGAGVKVYWQHEAEHLSTLVTSATRPPPDPESSLKRLRQLADNHQLTITPVNLMMQEYNFKREFLVTNIDTGEICERIPLEDIITPIYKESNDPTDAYNNLLMFNVNACASAKDGPPQHEMHIFQCVSAPAHEIVDLLSEHEGYTPQVYGQPYAAPEEEPYEAEPANPPDMNGNAGYTTHQMSEKALIDAEILLLNMCFDDIESYVGHIHKLQRARSLNNAGAGMADDNVSISAGDTGKKDKKEKKKHRFIFKKKSSSNLKGKNGDMPRVTSNASLSSEIEIPISDDELIDLFEKIKFSIILLSRLQGYVTEPNPPLLTHKLFSMMKQPIDFIRDPTNGKPEMAKKITAPLFTDAAITLIQNSLIEPELSLWHELGDGWCVPKDQWKEEVPVYIPQFKCGFQPQPDQYHHTLFDVPQTRTNRVEPSLRSNASRTRMAQLAEIQSHEEFLNYLRSRGAKIARVKRDFLAESEQEISLKAGEYVEVVDDSLNWNRLRNRKGGDGYAPYTVLDYNVL